MAGVSAVRSGGKWGRRRNGSAAPRLVTPEPKLATSARAAKKSEVVGCRWGDDDGAGFDPGTARPILGSVEVYFVVVFNAGVWP